MRLPIGCMFLAIFIIASSHLVLIAGESTFPLLLLISFDGFRYDYVDHVDTPNFHKLIYNGVRAKWMNSLFVTKTFPNHFSITTGLYQETHGIVGNIMYDPVFDESFDMDNNESKWWDNGFSMPIWIANQIENPDRASGGCMWPGTDSSFYQRQADYILPLNESTKWEERVDTVISWFTNPSRPANCVLLYFEEPDLAGHFFGPLSPQVIKEINRADALIGYLLDKLTAQNLLQNMNILIVSDHGMAEVPFESNVEMGQLLDLDSVKVIGNTPIWQISPYNKSDIESVYQTLLNASQNGYQFVVYKREDIPEEFHYKNHRRVLPILIIANENFGIVSRKAPIPSKVFIRGQHGYSNDLLSMKPVFIAYGPAFKKNIVVEPFTNIDLYPLMSLLLNIPIRESNGSLDNVLSMLDPKFLNPLIKQNSFDLLSSAIIALGGFVLLGGFIALYFGISRPKKLLHSCRDKPYKPDQSAVPPELKEFLPP